MPGYTSQARQNAYDNLRLLQRQKAISSTVFKKEKAKIDKREAKSVAYAEAKRARKAQEAQARREAKKATTAQRKLIAKIPSNLEITRIIVIDEAEEEEGREKTIRELWKRIKGSQVRILVVSPGGNKYKIDKTDVVEGGDSGYKSYRRIFIIEGSDGGWLIEGGDKIIVLLPTTIKAKLLFQKYRDGITNCVFTPIKNKLKLAIDASDKKEQQKRLGFKLRKMNELETLYDDGVPEDKMEEVAKASGFKITLFDVLGNQIMVYNEKGRNGAINMTNTRENHVDIGLVVTSDPVGISQDAMISLWKQLKGENIFYMVDGDLNNGLPNRIRTLEGAFEVEDPVREACRKFDKELRIMDYKINAVKQPDLNAFLKAGNIINSSSCRLGDGLPTGCADMPKAYTQFKKCHLYSGLLGHIHQFRSGNFDRAFIEKHLGFYQVIVKSGITPLLSKLGFVENQSLVLFSPEIIYMMNDGVIFDITQGAWGSRLDFDFPEYMLENRAYCNWTGRLGMENTKTSHTFNSSHRFAEHLATEHTDIYYWRHDSLVTIKKPAKNVFTAHHIFGSITSYVRILMMEAMKQFDINNLIRVVLDGIYYKGEKPVGLDWFRNKRYNTEENTNISWYSHIEDMVQFPPMARFTKNALLTGQGGSGKTYSVMTDKGLNTVLFVAPNNLLGQDIHKKYNGKYTTIHKLIGIECRPYYEEQRTPAVILIDEITQIEAEWIEKVFVMYPKSLILLAGDLDSTGRWFQTRGGNGDSWNQIWKPRNVDIVEFTEDRRSKDDELKRLKLYIRQKMRECPLEDCNFLMEQFTKTIPTVEFDFKEGDTCIAGTHRTNAKLLERGVVSGYYKKGGFVSDVELPNYEKRGSFTIHSYQGKTIETGDIWIFIDDLFEYAMLYTAISRAVNFSQIKFVKSKSL
jgi:hypothetical protein